jgi:hypothetical protein
MRVLFYAIGWVIVAAFAITFVVAILGLVGVVRIQPRFMKALFYKMILEVAAGGFFLFYTEQQPVPNAPDLSGEWEYKCTQHGVGDEHGGVATICRDGRPYAPGFCMAGRRDWVHTWDKQGDEARTIDPPFSWNSSWGAITEKDVIRFTYTITTQDGTINGYALGNIKYSNGRASEFTGSYYQLPPFKPQYGGLDFRRMKDSSDRKWKPKQLVESGTVK